MVRVFDEMLRFGSMVWPLLVSETTMSEERKSGINTHIENTQEQWASHSRIVCLIQHNGVY